MNSIFTAAAPVERAASEPQAAPAAPSAAETGAGPDARPMLHAATAVATPDGPRAVETLAPGDRVVLRGGEAMALDDVRRVVLQRPDWAYAPAIWPIRVPVGALGNAVPLRLSPGMRVRLPREGGFATVAHLTGIGGIARDRPLAAIRYFELVLPDHALVDVEGAFCESAPVGARVVDAPLSRDDARAAFARAVGRPAA